MEEQLLKDYVATYLNPKYNGDWDLVNSKFPELSGVDKQLLKDYVATYTNSKYNGDWDVVNSKFPELFPVGKSGVESPMAIQTAQEQPVKKKDTVSPFVDGGSELTKFDPRTGQVVQETPEFATAKPEVKVPAQKLPERTEFQFQPGKGLPVQKTAPLPKFVEEQLSAVTPELIGKTEENVVPQLKYQFGPLGFKFEETRAGDYMMATSPSGESIYISLDVVDNKEREAEANKLNAFLRKGATTVKNLSTLQKQYTDANKKIVSQKELDESLASINAEETKILARNAEFVKAQNKLEAEKAQLESVPVQQRNNPAYIARVNDFIERADQFSGEFQTFAKDAEDLSKRGQQLNKSIGKYTEMKAEQGTWYGAGLNAFANKSIYEEAKGQAGVAIDFIGEIISLTGLPIMSPENYEKNFIEQAKKEGINVAEGEDFISLANKLDPKTLAKIENRVIDTGKKSVKGEVIGGLDKASKTIMESSGVSADYYRSIQETFVGGALLGTLTSIPAMAGGPLIRTVLMGTQMLSGLDAEMANDPAFADVSENEKYLVKAPIAVAVGILESLGLSNLLNQKGFLNGIVLKALGKVGTGASYKTFGEVIKNEIESAVGRGALTLGAGFLAEAETGALQEVATIGIKEIYNMAKEKEMFDTPESVVKFIEQVGKSGIQEGIGAGVLSVPGSVSAAYTGKGFLGMDDAQFAMFEKMANDSNIQKGFVTRLKSRINNGEITAAEGKEILDNYTNSVGLFNSLPENLDMQGKKEAMNLLKEKRDLERQIEGKDQALTVPQRNRVNEINQQLTKLSEDAIQKQAAGEVPVQPGATVSEEVAQGEPQAEPQGIAEEGQAQEVTPTLDLDGEVSLLEQLLEQEQTAPTVSAGISISSDADVEALINKTQSRSQQATTKEEKDSANTRVKIIDTAKKAINTLKSILPNFDIVIHEDEGSYNAAMSEVSGVAGSRGNFFSDTTPDGNTTGRIDINLSKANSRTVAHEIAHGILINTFGDNANLFNDFRTRVSKVLKGDVNKQLNDFADRYVDPATGELLDVNHEEFLAELTGILEQQEANLSVTTMQKVAALINEFVSKITGGKFKPFEDTKNTKDVVDFFNTISGAIREGSEIQQLNSQEPYSSGVAIPVINPNEFVGKKFRSQLEIGDYKFPSGIDILTIADLPIRNLTELVRQYEGRVLIITSDATGYGVDRNGEPILGGFGFASNKKNVDDGIGFASVSTGTVRGTYTAAEKAYGTGKTLVLVMIQPPHTTINNSYGAKYILRGLKEIAASSKEELAKTKDAIKSFIKGSKAIQNELKNDQAALKRGSEKRLFDLIDSIDENTNLEEAVKEFLNDTTFTIRKELGKGIILENKNIRTNKSTNYSKIALNNVGYNIYDFLKEYGDNTFLTDDLILNNTGGYVVGGFELDVLPKEQRETLINDIQGSGIVHPLFNAKLPGNNHFRLDGLYDVQENFSEYAKPDTEISLSKEERDDLVREIYKDDKFYKAEARSIPLDKRSYTNLTVPAKTEFKDKYLKQRGLLTEATPNVPTKVAKGEGFIPKEGASEQMSKRNFVSRSQINDSLSKASGTTQVATTTGSYSKAANILKSIGVRGDVLDYGAGLGLGTDAMSDVLGKDVESLEINPERWKGRKPVKYTDANQIDKKYDGIVSLNVVNVVPKEIRDFIVLDIFNNLKEGGTAIISSRGFKGDINQAKNFVAGPEEKSYIIKRKQDGETIDVFQKGYDGNELVEYVQGLLGDSAEVVSNNTFGNKGVVITKLSNVKSRSQLPGNDAQRIVNLGRANGLSDQAISNVLEKRGFTQEAIDTAIGKAEPAAKKVEVTEEFAPGYNRVLNNMFGEKGVVAKSRRRGVSKEDTIKNAINYLQGTKVYENATDVQREAMVRNVNKELEKREKRAPSAKKVLGQKKDVVTITVDLAKERDRIIKEQIKLAKEVTGDLNEKRAALADAIRMFEDGGVITTAQTKTIINRISKVNLNNPIMVDRLLAYIEKVFDNANYAADMDELRKLQRQARSRNHTSMTDAVNQFTSINPEDIPLDKVQDYKKALDFLNNRTPSYTSMNEIYDKTLSYQVSKEFDAVKTNDDLIDKYKSIMSNKVENVEDYVALIKDINSFKRKAYQLLKNEAISQEEYNDLIDGAGKDQSKIEEKYAEQIKKIKSDLISEIKTQRPKTNPEFSNEENDLIRRYLELSDVDLKSLSPEDLFVLNDLLENIRNGEIDPYRFSDVVSRAYTSSGIDPLAKQIDDSKFDMTSEEGRKELSENESSFWEGLLGMGRAKAGALQKFIISPFNRAIASYENSMRKSFDEFLKLKKKYDIDNEQMNKIGMLTTYLQEHMAQFDPKNKGIDNIGKRDWFKEILSDKSMRSKYSTGKPSLKKMIGLGSSDIDVIEKIWNSLPKDKDGNVDPKAVYDSYIDDDGKFFNKKEKAFFDDVMKYKASEITPKQKIANEINGASFKEIPFHMMRVRLDGGKTQIAPTSSYESGVVRVKAGTGKERVSEAVGPIMTNFETLFIKGLEQTSRDYFLSKTLKDINNTLSGVRKKINKDKLELLDTISYTLSDALAYEFEKAESNLIFDTLLAARAAQTLLDPIRTGVELGSTAISFPTRAEKMFSGYKALFGEQKKMSKLLEFSDSPLRLRENINKAIDINEGKIEPQSRLTKMTTYLSGLPERTMMVTSWMPTFASEFQSITGDKFDINKFNDSSSYREKYGKAIREASAVADTQTEKIIGPTTKAAQRREIRIAPKFLASIIGREGTVSKSGVAGKILGFFSNYPYREATEFINGFKESAELIRKGDVMGSLSKLQKPLGVSLNLAAYGFLGTLAYAGQLILLGDEDDEERGNEILESLLTPQGALEEFASNAASLVASKYSAGGKALLQLAATIAIESTDDENQKAKIKKILKNSVFVDPLPVEDVDSFIGKDKALVAIARFVPQFVMLADRYNDLIGTKNEIKAIYDKVEKNGIQSLTKDEELQVLALNTSFTIAQAVLNVVYGTSIPAYNRIKTLMKGLKEEAGVAEVYKGEAPAKKKSSGGGGSSRGGGMNKTDMKKYNPELYNQMYGPGSAAYEVEQEVKAFEKEQREFKKKMKDQLYGGD
jgi:hypothetical protein